MEMKKWKLKNKKRKTKNEKKTKTEKKNKTKNEKGKNEKWEWKKMKNKKQKMKSKKQPKAKKKMVTTEENEFYHVKKKNRQKLRKWFLKWVNQFVSGWGRAKVSKWVMYVNQWSLSYCWCSIVSMCITVGITLLKTTIQTVEVGRRDIVLFSWLFF